MILTTERLLLREVEENDWQPVFAYQSDPCYRRYAPWIQDLRQDVQRLVREFIHWQQEQPRYKFQLAITLVSDSRLIGTCGLRKPTIDAQEAELGYELHPDSWGQGYATEAARALLRFGFDALHLRRVRAYCIAENAASVRVLERIGMRQERCLKAHTWMQRRSWDMFVYAISKEQWRARMQSV